MIDVSERISELLIEKHMTKYQLSKRSGIPLATISTMIKRNTVPRLDTVYKLCEGFNVTVSYFVCDKEEKMHSYKEKLAQFYINSRGDTEAIITSLIEYAMKKDKVDIDSVKKLSDMSDGKAE